MTLRPWREIAEPHADVREGKFQQAEFAADLSRVHAGTANREYQDAAAFFERTFITEGMRLLLDSVVKRLAGLGGDPVIQLQTAFGGGKTHTMLAVYHLAGGKAQPSAMPGIPKILDAAGIAELPKANMAVLDGVDLLGMASKPRPHADCTVHTLWGELAWQLGKEAGYQFVREADQSGTAPGKTELVALLESVSPCVILIDELVRYVSQFEEGKTLSGGTYDTQLSFIQALTEALKAVPTAVLLASLPYSDREAGSQQGVKALRALEHYFGRVQALWKPVATEEAFEIVRRRLFTQIADRGAMEGVCRTFTDFYAAHSGEFPQEAQGSKYLERLLHAYPIHPEIFDRLYEDWSTLDSFQRTRGVLKLMAKVIHRLWRDGNNDPLIMPGSLPLMDTDTRNEALYYLPPGWDPVIERDVDGERSETWEIENLEHRFGSPQACRRIARAIFLGSAPSTANQGVRGLEVKQVMLGVVQPGQPISLFKDALQRLGDRLHYLNQGNNRYWLDTRPNLRREMEERKRRFDDRGDVHPAISEGVRTALKNGVFTGVHIFTNSSDVPDDQALRLVVLPPDASYSKGGHGGAREAVRKILEERGNQPRLRRNRLIFVAPDYDTVGRLNDAVRSMLAWDSIVAEYHKNIMVLNNLEAQQAENHLKQATGAFERMIRETFKWLLVPSQQATPGQGISAVNWEPFTLSPSATSWSQEIERVMKENELLISEWAPIHLHKMLATWFWKGDDRDESAQQIWQQTCQQLYLPRLKDESVFVSTLVAGSASRDFFGLAQGKGEQGYLGFSFGQRISPVLDASLLLIEPNTAAAHEAALLQAQEEAAAAARARAAETSPPPVARPAGNPPEHRGPVPPPAASLPTAQPKKRFYATVDLEAIQATRQFSDLVHEVVSQFTQTPGVKVTISVEIQAHSLEGFSENLQRAVRENCHVLKVRTAEFEE